MSVASVENRQNSGAGLMGGSLGSSVLLFFWLVGASTAFSSTPTNPFGVFGLRELFLALTVAWVGLGLTFGTIRGPLDYAIIGCTLLFVGISILSSYASYGQPMLYGLLEDRRFFGLWLYFPLRDAIRQLGFDRALNLMFFVAFTIAVLGFLYKYGVVAGWADVTYDRNRLGRANIATPFVIMMVAMAWYRWNGWQMGKLRLAGLAFMLVYLVVVAQTRQSIIALLGSIMMVFFLAAIRNGRGLTFLSLSAAALAVIVFAIVAPATAIALLPDQFQELLSERYLQDSVRTIAYTAALNDLLLFGHGALSLQFDNGFANYYGEMFFIADIGIVGTLYRFGIFAIPFIIYTLLLFRYIVKWSLRVRPISYFYALSAGSLTLLLPWLTAAILEFRSEQMATLLAFAAYLKFAWHRELSNGASQVQSSR